VLKALSRPLDRVAGPGGRHHPRQTAARCSSSTSRGCWPDDDRPECSPSRSPPAPRHPGALRCDLRIVERLAWRAGVPKGAVESLSTDVTGDGAPDVVLLTRTADALVLFVAEGRCRPWAAGGAWTCTAEPRPASSASRRAPSAVHVEDHGAVSHALECDESGPAPVPRRRARPCASTLPAPGALAERAGGAGGQAQGRCPAVHVFFDGSDLRFWSGTGAGGGPPPPAFPPARCALA
jgi:hypothetical protein